jgi:hypothetical protein
MPAVGGAPLILAGLVTALRAAIPMAAVAMRADIEDGVTVQAAAGPLPEDPLSWATTAIVVSGGGQRRSVYVSLEPVCWG